MDARSVESLLEAAGASPTASHCLPSIAHAFGALMQHGSSGGRRAAPKDLHRLLASARDDDAHIAHLEDYVPYDVTLPVCVRWGKELYRMLPGTLSRPVAAVQDARLLASCIDPVLERDLGYGLGDAVELVLRRVDHVSAALAPVWPIGPAPNPGDPPSITPDEINVAAGLQDIAAQVAECDSPERARRALASLSLPRNRLAEVVPSQYQTASFGTAVAVRLGANNCRPLPAALLMEVIPALASDLAARAHLLDRAVSERWHAKVFETIDRALRGSGHRVMPVHDPADERPVGFVVEYSPQQVLLVALTAALTGDRLQQALDSQQRALSADWGVERLQGQLSVPSDAEIEALQVVACAESPRVFTSLGAPMMTLQDLLWTCRSTSRSPADLWHYVRARRIESTRLFVSDEIDAWEWWVGNDKSFHAGGSRLDSMGIVPGFADAEWRWAAGMSDTERALLALGLRGATDWPIVDDSGTDVLVLDLVEGEMIRVLRWHVPIGFYRGPASRAPQSNDLLADLIDGTAFRLAGIKDICERLLQQAGITSLMITFCYDPDGSTPLAASADSTPGTLGIAWADILGDAMIETPEAVEAQIGAILAKALPAQELRQEFLQAWGQGAPCIRRDVIYFEQKTVHEVAPVIVDPVHRSEASRRLAEHLSGSSEVSRGAYAGDEAKFLENDTIYPWLINHLRADLQRYDSDEMLTYALGQMELLNCKRHTDEKRLALRLGFAERSAAGDQLADDDRKEAIILARCVQLIVEQLLSLPAGTGQPPSDLGWGRTLGIAALCIESCFRSEAIHRGLIDTTTTISEVYVVDTESGAEAGDIDMGRYTAARLHATRPKPVKIGATETTSDSAEAGRPPSIAESLPELGPVDQALKETLGFGLDALIGCYKCAIQWEVPPERIVGSTDRASFVQAAVDANPQVASGEYGAALEWLKLESIEAADIEPWAVEHRAERIATRPFVIRGDDLLILPWSAGAALRIVYNYLNDGRLPWFASTTDHGTASGTGRIVDALNDYRQSLNRKLEKQCTQALEGHPSLTVRSNIEHTKCSQYGITDLCGEVDVLCLDADSATIWVIEVKDPSEPFSQRRVGNIIDEFHKQDGYVDLLLRKTRDIRASASEVARAVAPAHQHRDWRTRPLIVTRNVSPAAFVHEPRVAFCTLSELPEAILNADQPAPIV